MGSRKFSRQWEVAKKIWSRKIESLMGSREKVGHEKLQSLMFSHEKVGREKLQSRMDVVAFKITTLVARVSLVATVMLGPQLCRLPFRVLV